MLGRRGLQGDLSEGQNLGGFRQNERTFKESILGQNGKIFKEKDEATDRCKVVLTFSMATM